MDPYAPRSEAAQGALYPAEAVPLQVVGQPVIVEPATVPKAQPIAVQAQPISVAAQPMYPQGPMYSQAQPFSPQQMAHPQTAAVAPEGMQGQPGGVVAQPIAPGSPSAGGRTPYWKDSIFSCCDQIVPSWVMSCCCPCFHYAKIKRHWRLEILGLKADNYWGSCIIYAIMMFLPWFVLGLSGIIGIFADIIALAAAATRTWMLGKMRMEVRKQRYYYGNGFEDMFCSFCCPCCVLAQMSRDAFQYRKGMDTCDCAEEFGCTGGESVEYV